MKHLELTELAKAISEKTGCSIENAVRFVDVQDQYFDLTGINTKAEDENVPQEQTIVNDADMMKYIIDNTGMSESFARNLADAELAYMKEQGLISDKGEVEQFIKNRFVNE